MARTIREAGVGILLFDLLTKDEERVDAHTGRLRFDIEFLARRLVDATNWITSGPATQSLQIGYFGSSTGAAESGAQEFCRVRNYLSTMRKQGRGVMEAIKSVINGEFDASRLKLECSKDVTPAPRAEGA